MITATKYLIFAIAATGVNIGLQWISFRIYNGLYSLYLSMAIGTLGGLIVKYILDKKFIFYYETEKHTENIEKFIVYSFMGVVTTIIFWTTEITFDALWNTSYSKYIGAVTGLGIGYVTKYYLDKKYVFRK